MCVFFIAELPDILSVAFQSFPVAVIEDRINRREDEDRINRREDRLYAVVLVMSQTQIDSIKLYGLRYMCDDVVFPLGKTTSIAMGNSQRASRKEKAALVGCFCGIEWV